MYMCMRVCTHLSCMYISKNNKYQNMSIRINAIAFTMLATLHENLACVVVYMCMNMYASMYVGVYICMYLNIYV